MYVNPGELKKRIKIIHLIANGTNKNGFQIKKEKIIHSCYAKVSNTSGTEIVKANSEFSEAKKRFLIRHTNKDINTDMIVRYNGKDHNIRYINPYGDSKEYLEIWTDLSERV